jgi:hypothetical protein
VRPLDPIRSAEHWHMSQQQGLARPNNIASSRGPSRPCRLTQTHQHEARVAGSSPALMALSTDTLECNGACAPWSPDTQSLQGGAHAARLRARRGGAGGSRLRSERPWRPRSSIPWAPGSSRTSRGPPIAADRDGGQVGVTSQATSLRDEEGDQRSRGAMHGPAWALEGP